MSSYIQSGDG